MSETTPIHVLWALVLGGVSAVSLPLGSLIGLNVRFSARSIAIFAAFGAGALIAALSVELVAPTATALTETNHEDEEHAYANFSALLIGGVLGGLLFVALGWTRRRIFLMWFALMIATAIGAGLGFLLAGVLTETWLVFAEGVAAGAMLTMIAAAMIPEAAAHGSPGSVGLSTLGGFLAAVAFKLFE